MNIASAARRVFPLRSCIMTAPSAQGYLCILRDLGNRYPSFLKACSVCRIRFYYTTPLIVLEVLAK